MERPGGSWVTRSRHDVVVHTRATLGVLAKLSNEAVKCREYDAVRGRPTTTYIREASAGTTYWCSRRESNLNLGIKRKWTVLVRRSQEASRRASCIRRSDALVPQSGLACHGVSWVSCQTSCQEPAPSRPISALRQSMGDGLVRGRLAPIRMPWSSWCAIRVSRFTRSARAETLVARSPDSLTPVLSQAYLPHARERDKSAEVHVTHQSKLSDASVEGLSGRFTRTCTTLRGYGHALSDTVSECLRLPREPGFMAQQCHTASASVTDCPCEGVT